MTNLRKQLAHTALVGVLAFGTPLVARAAEPADTPLPPTYAEYIAAAEPLLETPEARAAREQVLSALESVLAEPLDGEGVTNGYTLDQTQQSAVDGVQGRVQEVNTMQVELARGVKDNQVDIAETKKMYLEVQSLKQQVGTLRAGLSNPSSSSTVGSVLPLPDEAATATEDTASGSGAAATEAVLAEPTEAELAALEAELAYREELIRQLLESMGEDVPATDGTLHASAFSANLLAISEHPVVSGGGALFVIMVIWLLRGRLAEFSGFGVKLTFAKGDSAAGRRKTKGRRDDDQTT